MQIRAKKSLGQHFLNSKKALDQIVQASGLSKNDIVLEIGPGTGILTKEILSSGAKVIAIEKDIRAFDLIKQNFKNEIKSNQLQIINKDILEMDMNSIGLQNSKYVIVANIPYYITGAILEKFLEYEPRPQKMVLLVQKEVAERIITRDGKESILSISVKAFGNPKIIDTVPRGAFVPPPNVDSAILLIDEISDTKFSTQGINIKHFFKIVKAGFAHKRKYLIRNIESVIPNQTITEIWSKNNIDPKIRPENVNISTWLNIAKGQ
jgi:16S rRNA (adenine1518-N6/adenine1519-N6)-dimethyltransferase